MPCWSTLTCWQMLAYRAKTLAFSNMPRWEGVWEPIFRTHLHLANCAPSFLYWAHLSARPSNPRNRKLTFNTLSADSADDRLLLFIFCLFIYLFFFRKKYFDVSWKFFLFFFFFSVNRLWHFMKIVSQGDHFPWNVKAYFLEKTTTKKTNT